jgi:quinol monooxygenase YgiN
MAKLEEKKYLVLYVSYGSCQEHDPGPYAKEDLNTIFADIVEQEGDEEGIVVYEVGEPLKVEKQYTLKQES